MKPFNLLSVVALILVGCSAEEKPVPLDTVEALSEAYEVGKGAILKSREYESLHEATIAPLTDWKEGARYMDEGNIHVQKKDGTVWTTDDKNHATVLLDNEAKNGSGEIYRPSIFANLEFSDGEWRVRDIFGVD